jgi:hypothetical protein
MEIFLEILKLTLPALIVFLTVYFVLKSYLDHQQQMKLLELKQDISKTTLPLKLQAYERLSLFCERIAIPSLILRLSTPGVNSQILRHSMLISIQKEFEHNITQQMYISEQLWKIVKLACDQTVDTINLIGSKVEPNSPSEVFVEHYYKFAENSNMEPLEKALAAIKQEAAILLA